MHYSCGFACLYLNRVDEALTHHDADLRASPGSATNFFNYAQQGNAHIRAGRCREATAALDQALALGSDFPLALIFTTVTCQMAGHTDEARELLLHTRRVEKAGTLEVWEMKFNRHLVRSPNLADLLEHLRTLWAEAA